MSKKNPKGLPIPTSETKPFWDGCKKHELHIQECLECESHQFYPRLYCMRCMSDRVHWVRASGRATIVSFTVVHRPVTKAFEADVPYVVALVKLEEGPQLMTNIVGCDPQEVHIEMQVSTAFEDWSDEISVLKFKPSVPE